MLKSRRARGFLVALLLAAPHVMRAQPGGQFLYPISVTVDRSANVLVSENQRNRISMFGPTGALGWHQGSQGNGDGQFNIPAGIVTDTQGFVYVADYGNSRVQKFNAATGAFVTKWGSAGTGQGQFRKPIAIAVDTQNNVSVLDNQTLKVQKFSNDGLLHKKVECFGT
jgi:DNA-binding beta-propeller fold protein YncE